MSKLYGLIGYPLEHSFSPAYFKKKFERENIDAEYRLFSLSSIVQLKALLEEYSSLHGLNVTIPYKEDVLSYVDELDADAAIVRAVNCIRIADGHTIGYNTDITGFKQSLAPLLKPYMDKALVLGSGGSSKAVHFVLNKLGIAYSIVSRTEQEGVISYKTLTDKIIEEHKLIINTTPLGMYPNVEQFPELPYHAIGREHVLFDLVYNPEETKFLELGRKQGAVTQNGLEMLELQAEASWQVWNL